MSTHRWGRAHSRPGVLSCLIALTLVMPGSTLAASRVVIGEVNWAGSSRSTADEWIELWNLGLQDQSLDGWRLEGASATPFVFDKTEIIQAQQSFLIANYDETNAKSALNVHPAIVSTDVALSNDTLALRLSDDQNTLVDQVGDEKKPAAGSTKPATAMVRIDTNVDGQTSSTWVDANATQNLDEGVGDLGTPGVCDGCSASSTAVTSTIIFVDTETTSTPSFATTTMPALALSTSTEVSTSTTLDGINFTSSTNMITSTMTTTTVATTTTIATTTTTTIFTTSPQPSVPPPVTIVTATTVVTPSPSTTCRARLETIFPAPSNGSEWVEVSGCETLEALAGWSIHDPQGLIVTVAASTAIEQADEGRFRILLPGQHLNNSGDTVMLRGSDSGLYDVVAYPSLKHDERYARRNDDTWWIPERVPNIVADATTSTSATIKPEARAASAQSANPQTTPSEHVSTIAPSTPVRSLTQTVHAASVTSLTFDEYLAHTKTRDTPPTRVAKPPQKTKPLSPSRPRSRTMASSSPQTPRVVLHGIVGTPPNLIAKRRFVLLNTEGKGILVYLSGSQPSPTLGQRINITGSLVINDDGTHLEMRARDRWQPSTLKIEDPKPTLLDSLEEDAKPLWRLVEVTGLVESRSGSTIHLMVDTTEVVAVIPTSLGYRSARLAIGTQIHLLGLLDTSAHPARLHPRLASDITIVERTTSPSNNLLTNTHNSLPPWIPVSAAGATVAAGYGLRRLRKWYEEKRLAQQLSTAIEQLSSPS